MARYLPLIVLAIFATFLIWMSRKALFPLVAAIVRGKKPTIWLSDARQNKCPHCGADVEMALTAPRKGEAAFRCSSCGLEGTWD
jgi:predicted RNA-binding Zn-ribbon protein involved in translation (DUF1610 family)